ncbi:MAG: GTP-binding protein [Candidatus Odinarchaeia archaeon]
MIVDWGKQTIQTKIVYYGPAMSGKTTTIKYIFRKLGCEERVKSIETTTGRTLFFDFAPFTIKQNSWNIEVQLWSATGQNYYAETRLTVLKGTDCIVFVADAQRHYLEENAKSWRELKEFFNDKLEREIPVVVCLNKIDLPNTVTKSELRDELKISRETLIFETSALLGFNVFEAFKAALSKVFLKTQ